MRLRVKNALHSCNEQYVVSSTVKKSKKAPDSTQHSSLSWTLQSEGSLTKEN